MGRIFSILALRGIAGIAGFFALLAAIILRKSSAIEERARNRLSAPKEYGINALEQECWDREDREGCAEESDRSKEVGDSAASRIA